LFFLLRGSSIQYAGSVALAWVIFMFLVVSRKHGIKEKIKILIGSFERAGYSMAILATLALVAQLVVSLISGTGIGVKFSSMIIAIGGEMYLLVLILAMLVCIILGMGMPTTAAYVLSASLVAPALTNLGMSTITAHMFVFYFAILSTITPPVCTGIYTVAQISEVSWQKIVPDALKLGLVGFIVPFMFVYNEALLMQGSALEIILTTIVKAVGIAALSVATVGFLMRRLNFGMRMLFLIAAGVTIAPGVFSNIIGIVLVIIVFALELFWSKKVSSAAAS